MFLFYQLCISIYLWEPGCTATMQVLWQSVSVSPHQTDSSGHRWYENTDASLLPLYAAVTTHSARKYGHNGLSFDCYWVWFRANVTKDMFLRLHQVKLNKKSSKCKRTFDGCTKSCWRIYLLMQPLTHTHTCTHILDVDGSSWRPMDGWKCHDTECVVFM